MRTRLKVLVFSVKLSNRDFRMKEGVREGTLYKSKLICDDGEYLSHSNLMRIKPTR